MNKNKLNILSILLLLPLIGYGMYKNGYLIYLKEEISFISMFRPLYLIIILILIKLISNKVFHKKYLYNLSIIEPILIAMILPYNISLPILSISYGILNIIEEILIKKVKLNYIVFIYIVILIIQSIFSSIDYTSIIEYNYNYSTIDLLIGRTTGGICSSSIILSFIIYIILSTSIYYKKEIPFYSISIYLLGSLIYYICTKDNTYFINSHFIFSSIFISSFPEYSPVSKISIIIYSILIGILSIIGTIIFKSTLVVYVVILVVSIIFNMGRKIK